MTKERRVQQAVLDAIGRGLVRAAHDVSDGGLAVCLAEMLMGQPELGLTVQLGTKALGRLDGVLFGEAQSRIVLAAQPEAIAEIELVARQRSIECHRLGLVDRTGVLQTSDGMLRFSVKEAREVYESAIPELLTGEL
jgi:phosphoribosylformylglycinamidine synthase